MHLTGLRLRNFRNIQDIYLEPYEGFNIFWGQNAQGKTNLLEGIYLLGNLKSFRGARNEQLIKNGETEALLEAKVEVNGVSRKINISVNRQGKSAKIDGKLVRSAGEFMGLLLPVLFSPEEVGLVKGSPSGRRSLIDRAVFLSEHSYLELAQEYSKHLQQRNRLLKENRGDMEIFPWTEGLVRTGALIRKNRRQYLARISPLLGEIYGNITGNTEKADIFFSRNETSIEELEGELRGEFERVVQREKRIGATLVGPHRDDPVFLVNGQSLRHYGSQGQQRSFILAFKTAQIMDMEKRKGFSPILLLDDMTSELDRSRQSYFFSFLMSRKSQVFITTTDIKPLIEEGFDQARSFRVQQGGLFEDR